MSELDLSLKMGIVRPNRGDRQTRSIAPPTFVMGDIKIWPIIDGSITYLDALGFPPIGSPDFDAHRHYVHDGHVFLDVGGFLIQTRDRLVLIDAGSGPGDGLTHRPPLRHEWWPAEILTGLFELNMYRQGFSPEDVTDVYLSHLHFDHVGWLSKNGRPFFPNATIRCEAHDLEYFTSAAYDDRQFCEEWNVVPLAQHLNAVLPHFDAWWEDALLAPGIQAIFTPGHTPGSCAFSVTSGDETVLILGDAVHCAQELCEPQYTSRYRNFSDLDLSRANESRQAIRALATRPSTFVSSPHFPGLRFGRLARVDRSQLWSFDWS